MGSIVNRFNYSVVSRFGSLVVNVSSVVGQDAYGAEYEGYELVAQTAAGDVYECLCDDLDEAKSISVFLNENWINFGSIEFLYNLANGAGLDDAE